MSFNGNILQNAFVGLRKFILKKRFSLLIENQKVLYYGRIKLFCYE